MNELKTEQTIEKIIDMIMDFGDGLLEFETKDINVLINQLTIQENYNDMLLDKVKELESKNKSLKNQLERRDIMIKDLDEQITELKKKNRSLKKEVNDLKNKLYTRWDRIVPPPSRDEPHI